VPPPVVPPRRVVGLDLAGSPNRRTGFCLLTDGRVTRTRVLGDDSEIVSVVGTADPKVVVIDAPLSLPRGRRSLDLPGPPHFRACDLELRRRGIRFFPLTLGPMRILTARGIVIKHALEARGLTVLEGYPGGTQDIAGWPRKSKGADRLQRALTRFGFTGDVADRTLTHDELDAICCAWAGDLLLRGEAILIGDPSEGTMVLPGPSVLRPRPPRPRGSRGGRADGRPRRGKGPVPSPASTSSDRPPPT